MQVVVDELLTRYELKGKGKLVLLLHGWGDNLDGLASLQVELAKKYRVLSVDLPGFGQTQPPKAVWDLDDYASFVQHLLEKLALKELYAVVGHSNGGALAIRAVAGRQLMPQKLVLVAASGIRQKRGLRRALLKVVAKVGNLATIWMPERYRRSLRKSLYGVAGSDMLVVEQLQETFKRTVRQDVQADAAQIGIPTLLIFGDKDQAVPLTDGERYQGLIKGSKLQIVPAGHFVHLDEPVLVVAAIKDFLA